MLFKTLGGFNLEGTSFSSPQSLLLLAYVALKGPVPRHSVLELFWPSQIDNTKRVKSLSDCVAKLKKIDSDLILARDKLLTSSVELDVFLFEEAVQTSNHQLVVLLYKGLFLEGIEYSKHWQLGEELQEWLDSVRASYQAEFISSALVVLESLLQDQDFHQIRLLSQRLLSLPFGFKSFTKKKYQRFKVVLKAANLTALQAELEAFAFDFEVEQTALKHLFGRDDLLSEAVNLVLGNRLTVVWGLAGVGKTVFIQNLSRQLTSFFDEVHTLSLTKFSADSTEVDVLAEFSSLLLVAFESKSHLKHYLASRRFLLCLDNVEHLSHLNSFWLELFSDCPELHFVFGSRVKVAFTEAVHLDLPCLSQSDSLALFEFECKRLGVTTLDVSESELSSLLRVLGGLPLAIKLLVPWFKVLPRAEVLKRAEHSLALLQPSSASQSASYEALISSSVDLFPAKLKQSFLALGVFQGDFDFAAIQAITGISDLDLRALLDSSLMQFNIQTERYSLHPLLSLYLQSFESSLQSEHAKYFIALLSHQETRKRLWSDLANFEKAWLYTLKASPEFLLDFVQLLKLLADELNTVALCLKLATALNEKVEGDSFVLGTLAWLYLRAGNYDLSKIYAENAVTNSSETQTRIFALNALGAASDLQGDFDMAESSFKQVLGLSSSKEDCSALLNLAVSYLKTGKFQAAQTYLIKAEHCTSLRLEYLKAWLHYAKKEYAESLVAFELVLARAYELAISRWPFQIKARMIPVLLKLGRVDEAFELAETSLMQVKQKGLLRSEIAFGSGLGDCYLAKHAYSEAFQNYLKVLWLSQDSGSTPSFLALFIRLLLTHKFELDFASCLYNYCKHNEALIFYEDALLLQGFSGHLKNIKGSNELFHLNPVKLSQLILLRYAN